MRSSARSDLLRVPTPDAVMDAELLAQLESGATLVTPTRRLARDLARRFNAAISFSAASPVAGTPRGSTAETYTPPWPSLTRTRKLLPP